MLRQATPVFTEKLLPFATLVPFLKSRTLWSNWNNPNSKRQPRH